MLGYNYLMLQQDIRDGIKESMLAKNTVRLETLRGISAAFTNELVSKGRTPQDVLTDEEGVVVISRLAKQRKDSIDQFLKGGRSDLVSEEQAQLAILETFLPAQMSIEEIETIAKNKKSEMNITDAKEKGKLMSELMKELKGKADGMEVKKVVDSLF